MAFGLNRAEVIGRLGADVTVNHLQRGGRVANLSVATDESYLDRQSGERVDKTEWHRIVTFQDGLIDMLEKHAKKGRLVYIAGKLQTRRWSKPGEDGDRFSTEILIVPGGRVQFLDKPNGNGSAQPPAAPASAPAMPAGGTPRARPTTSTTTSRSRDDRRFLLPPTRGPALRRRSPLLQGASSPPGRRSPSGARQAGAHIGQEREHGSRDSIFAHGAVVVPDFVTPAEEARILLRIAEAPWLTELSRRVQHYGYRYDYRGGGSRVPAPAFPRWTAAWLSGCASASAARSRCSAS